MIRGAEKEDFIVKQYKIGVFGAGRGVDIAKNFRLLDCEIVALCDDDEKRLENGLKRLGDVPTYRDFDEFLDCGMDAVILANSFHEHELHALPAVSTFADGIAVKRPGDTTFAMVEQYVDEIVTVSEDEIAAAILALIEKQKLIAEGAGAVSVAAAMFGKLPIQGKKVVCLVSGGNIDVNILNRVITRGLVMGGRNSNLMIALEDKPGQLETVSRIISECGANVVSVYHDRADTSMTITSCFLKLGLETRDHAHIAAVRKALSDAGFQLVTERA